MGAPLASETERLGHKTGGGVLQEGGSANACADPLWMLALGGHCLRSIAGEHDALPRCEFGAKQAVDHLHRIIAARGGEFMRRPDAQVIVEPVGRVGPDHRVELGQMCTDDPIGTGPDLGADIVGAFIPATAKAWHIGAIGSQQVRTIRGRMMG